MDIYEFDGEILKSDERGAGAFVRFPYDVMETFGTRGQVKVACEFDGVPYRGSIVNMGAGPVIGILKSIREEIGKQPGDIVHVKLWRDEEPREVIVPPELAAAFRANEEAKKNFDALSYSRRRECASWIYEAKKEETRRNRADKAIEKLENGEKSPKGK
jgi:hypothetical protein